MQALLATIGLILWFILMFWVYQNSPQWFFVPFFFVTTLTYLKLMETSRS